MIKYYSKREYQLIANLYNLGDMKNLTPLYRGYGGSAKVKIETTKGEFIVSKETLSNKKDVIHKSIQSLQYEIDMLNIVKGMPVPCFHKSTNKKYIEKFKNGWIVVYTFIPGSSPKNINEKMAYELGKFLGEFHLRGNKFKKEIPSRRRFYDLSPSIMKKMRVFAYKQKNKKIKGVIEEIEKEVNNNRPPKNLPTGPIHVDIGHNNELFVGNKLSGIIDFGNFYRDAYMIDVGKTIMWNCCSGGKLDIKLFHKFITGYTSKRTFTKSEELYLNKSILYAIYSHIWVDLYHVPLKYVPESWPLYLMRTFLPVAKDLENKEF